MCRIGHHTRNYSLYASWVADSSDLVVLLGSYDSYSYLNQKDHRKTYIYIYIYIDIDMCVCVRKSEKGLDEKGDVQMKNASLYSTKR